MKEIFEIRQNAQKGDYAYNNFFKQDKTRVAYILTKELLYEKINN